MFSTIITAIATGFHVLPDVSTLVIGGIPAVALVWIVFQYGIKPIPSRFVTPQQYPLYIATLSIAAGFAIVALKPGPKDWSYAVTLGITLAGFELGAHRAVELANGTATAPSPTTT